MFTKLIVVIISQYMYVSESPYVCNLLTLYSPWNSVGQNTGVGSCSLLQGILPTQWSNSGLPHCRWILYQLSHQGSPRIWQWVAYPFSRGLPDLRIELGSPALQVDSLPSELPGKPSYYTRHLKLVQSSISIISLFFPFIFISWNLNKTDKENLDTIIPHKRLWSIY